MNLAVIHSGPQIPLLCCAVLGDFVCSSDPNLYCQSTCPVFLEWIAYLSLPFLNGFPTLFYLSRADCLLCFAFREWLIYLTLTFYNRLPNLLCFSGIDCLLFFVFLE